MTSDDRPSKSLTSLRIAAFRLARDCFYLQVEQEHEWWQWHVVQEKTGGANHDIIGSDVSAVLDDVRGWLEILESTFPDFVYYTRRWVDKFAARWDDYRGGKAHFEDLSGIGIELQSSQLHRNPFRRDFGAVQRFAVAIRPSRDSADCDVWFDLGIQVGTLEYAQWTGEEELRDYLLQYLGENDRWPKVLQQDICSQTGGDPAHLMQTVFSVSSTVTGFIVGLDTTFDTSKYVIVIEKLGQRRVAFLGCWIVSYLQKMQRDILLAYANAPGKTVDWADLKESINSDTDKANLERYVSRITHALAKDSLNVAAEKLQTQSVSRGEWQREIKKQFFPRSSDGNGNYLNASPDQVLVCDELPS